MSCRLTRYKYTKRNLCSENLPILDVRKQSQNTIKETGHIMHIRINNPTSKLSTIFSIACHKNCQLQAPILKLNRTDCNVKNNRTFLLCIASMVCSSSKHHSGYTHAYELRPPAKLLQTNCKWTDHIYNITSPEVKFL